MADGEKILNLFLIGNVDRRSTKKQSVFYVWAKL